MTDRATATSGPRAPSPRWRCCPGRRRTTGSTCRSGRWTPRWTRCGAARSTPRWCRSRTPSRAGCRRRSTRWPRGDPLVVIGEVNVPDHLRARCAGRYAARGRPRGRHPLARLGAGPRLDGRDTCRGATYVPTLSTAAAAAGLARARSSRPTTRRCARRSPRPTTGSRCSPSDIGDRAGAVTRFVLVARPGLAARADRRRQDDGHALPARRPGRRAARAARAVRGARHQHDPARVAPDQGLARLLLLLDRLRGPRPRRARRRGAHGAQAGVRRGALPRVLPARGRRRCTRGRAAHRRRGLQRGARDWLEPAP